MFTHNKNFVNLENLKLVNIVIIADNISTICTCVHRTLVTSLIVSGDKSLTSM